MFKIAIDAGHGGKDPGATNGNYKEKDFNLKIATGVAKKLGEFGIKVVLTRPSDVTVELPERVAIAEHEKVNLFYSIHCNAGGGTGYEDYIYTKASEKSKQYQKIINDNIAFYIKGFGIVNRGMKQQNFHVLRETTMPAVLSEFLFIDNPNDLKYLTDNNFINGLIDAICTALITIAGGNPSCINCLQLKELKDKISKLEQKCDIMYDENQHMRQAIRQATGTLAPFML